MESSRGRRGGSAMPECRRRCHFHHLCCGVHLLYWQERYGTTAAKCPPCSHLLHHLSSFKQSHDSLRIAVAEERKGAFLRPLVASDNCSWSGLPDGHGA